MRDAGRAAPGSRADYCPGTPTTAPHPRAPVWSKRGAHEQWRTGRSAGARDDPGRRGGSPGMCGNGGKHHDGGEYMPSWGGRSGLSECRMGADSFHLDVCFLPISAYAEDWPRPGPIFPNSLKTCLPVDSTPRRSWMSRSALPRLLRAIVRWISDRPSKPWFGRNKKRPRR